MEKLAEDVKKLREDVDRIMHALGVKNTPVPQPMFSIVDRVKALENDMVELQKYTVSQPK